MRECDIEVFIYGSARTSEMTQNIGAFTQSVVKTAVDLAIQHPGISTMMVLYHSAEFVQSCYLVSCSWNSSSGEPFSAFFVSDDINATLTPRDVCQNNEMSFLGRKLVYAGAVKAFIEPQPCSAEGMYQNFCN